VYPREQGGVVGRNACSGWEDAGGLGQSLLHVVVDRIGPCQDRPGILFSTEAQLQDRLRVGLNRCGRPRRSVRKALWSAIPRCIASRLARAAGAGCFLMKEEMSLPSWDWDRRCCHRRVLFNSDDMPGPSEASLNRIRPRAA
jgi:hypothetical protein